MSAAIHAKNARERANIAARYLRYYADRKYATGRVPDFSRAFCGCLEMGDGDEVLRILIGRAKSNPRLRSAIEITGHGFWLEPGYLDRNCGK